MNFPLLLKRDMSIAKKALDVKGFSLNERVYTPPITTNYPAPLRRVRGDKKSSCVRDSSHRPATFSRFLRYQRDVGQILILFIKEVYEQDGLFID